MRLFGFTCPDADCRAYHAEIDGIQVGGELSIRCPACGSIETIKRKTNPA